jgi:hypothetical protein
MINKHFCVPILVEDNFCMDEIPAMKKIIDDEVVPNSTLDARIETTHHTNQALFQYREFDNFNQAMLEKSYHFMKALGYQVEGVGITNMWANRVSANDYHMPHAHGGAIVTGVYYLDAPKEAQINFSTPSYDLEIHPEEPTEYNELKISYDCKPGRLMLFKGSTKHWCHSHLQDEYKYTLAFNISRQL